MNDDPPPRVPGPPARGPARAAVAVVAALEAAACLAFAGVVWAESIRGPASSGGVVEGVAAVAVAAFLVVVGIALARGARRTAGAYAVVQALVVLIGLSQGAAGVAAGRVAFAASWLAASAVGAAGLVALAALMRRTP